jgi:hypothetical protein
MQKKVRTWSFSLEIFNLSRFTSWKSPLLEHWSSRRFQSFHRQVQSHSGGAMKLERFAESFFPRNQLKSRRGRPNILAVYRPLYSIPCVVIGADFQEKYTPKICSNFRRNFGTEWKSEILFWWSENFKLKVFFVDFIINFELWKAKVCCAILVIALLVDYFLL